MCQCRDSASMPLATSCAGWIRRPLSGIRRFPSGRTPFDELMINTVVRVTREPHHGGNGMSMTRHVGQSELIRIARRQVQVPTRDLDLKGTATRLLTSTDQSVRAAVSANAAYRWDDPISCCPIRQVARSANCACRGVTLDGQQGRNAGDAACARSSTNCLLNFLPGNLRLQPLPA